MKTPKCIVLLAAAVSLGVGSMLSAQSFGPNFITNFPELKPVFTEETNPNGTYIVATITDYDNVDDNELNIKTMTYAVVPLGGGLFERRVNQTVITVTPVAGSPGVVDVTTQSELFVTPVDSDDNPTGAQSSTPSGPTTQNDVDEDDLDLPPSTEFYPLNEELNDPVIPSDP